MPQSIQTNIELQHREDLKTICNMAYQKGLLSGNEGNFSLKIDNELILVTPKNSHKGIIEAKDFVMVDIRGNIISNSIKEPTTELALHLEAYKKRPDVRAVVHAHPITAVSFSIAGIDLNQPVVPEIIVLLGEVPTVPYCEPGTDKLAILVGQYLEKHDAVVLERHGAVTIGKDIFDAYFKMESLEHAAKTMYGAYLLGDLRTLDQVYIDELVKQRHKIYGKEVEEREGTKLFQFSSKRLKLKNIFKKLIEGDSPVFQRVLNLVNDVTLAAIYRTNYSQKMSQDEKEQLSRELTSSFLSMILGRFTKK